MKSLILSFLIVVAGNAFANQVFKANDLIQSDDIVVVNQINDSILLLDSTGGFKTVLFNDDNSLSLRIGGVTFDAFSNQLLFTYDSTSWGLDEVRSVSMVDGGVSKILNHSDLNGILNGVARLSDGSYVILKSATQLEKFDGSLRRQSNGVFPMVLNPNVQISSLKDGGFLTCSTSTSNTLSAYSSTGSILKRATSVLPGPSIGQLGASGCAERDDGSIVVSYSGTTDTVRAYSSDLKTVLWDFSNRNVLSNPGRVAVRSNGNILVTDTSYNHIVELSSEGVFLRILAGGILSTPGYIAVIP